MTVNTTNREKTCRKLGVNRVGIRIRRISDVMRLHIGQECSVPSKQRRQILRGLSSEETGQHVQLTVRSDGRSEKGPEAGRHPNITAVRKTLSRTASI